MSAQHYHYRLGTIDDSGINFPSAGQIHRYVLQATLDASGKVKLGFGSVLDQSAADESWGLDNVVISTTETGTALSLAGLAGGGYYLYTADAAGNVSTFMPEIITIDSTLPTATLTTGTAAPAGSATVQSNEVGAAYLVKTDVTVTNLASITGAADAKWNRTFLATANSATSLSLMA